MASVTTTASISGSRVSGGLNAVFASGVSSDYATRLRRARLGLLVAATPILMLFTSFTSAYVVRQGLPSFDPRTNSMVRDWISVKLPGILFVNTCVLLLSSVGMELARRQSHKEALAETVAFTEGAPARTTGDVPWMAVTLALGILFLAGQWVAWGQLRASGFYLATTPSSSFIYLLTGTHAIHLLGGVIALFVAGIASLLHRSAATRGIVVDITGWYWHFMAAIWVYILCLLEFAG
jgi:cytochrome c oxidase subunit 3